MGHELMGKKVGIVALGAVGKATAKIFEGFGCDICFYDPFVQDSLCGYEKMELEELFKQSDIVTLHLPVTPQTKGLINKDLLNLMKKDAVLVNAARSAVVVTKDLVEVLESKKIWGAVTDVYDTEPIGENEKKLIELDNLITTPHIFGATYEVTNHQSRIIINSLMAWLYNDGYEKYVFNKDVLK